MTTFFFLFFFTCPHPPADPPTPPPLPRHPVPPTNSLSASVSLSLLCLGGLRCTTAGCKTWIWCLVNFSLATATRPLRIGRAWVAWLSLTGRRPNGFTVSSLTRLLPCQPPQPTLVFFVFLSGHFRTSFSWTSSLCPAAFCSLLPLERALVWLYLSTGEDKKNKTKQNKKGANRNGINFIFILFFWPLAN